MEQKIKEAFFDRCESEWPFVTLMCKLFLKEVKKTSFFYRVEICCVFQKFIKKKLLIAKKVVGRSLSGAVLLIDVL